MKPPFMTPVEQSSSPSWVHFATSFGLELTVLSIFALATALAAQAKIDLPWTPVPMTLQTAVVLFSGLALGSRRGATAQALYLALGTLGAPFFAGASGPLVLTGSTAGYLLAFPLAAALAAPARRFLDQGLGLRPLLALTLATFLASLPILGLGALGLKLWGQLNWTQTWTMGIAPFLVGDVLKTFFAVGLFSTMKAGQRRNENL